MTDTYKQHGYKDREDYLHWLSEEYDVDVDSVTTLADLFGPNEDFDGLVAALEDI